ncbi:hypothetical protein GCM10007940_03750 [Portibacter lacus]|uniref:Outer membrane protein beta-barrel domain-containing protein n=1 Tax=Portibacter lacus TaxID=1099794 RepID=A0AA37SKW5_9BACT|nr:hypothetical protein GCM10007940_03750 [Portibacter lacus]
MIEGGANYGKAKLTKNDILNNENILGYYISGIPKYKLTNRFTLQSEFQYSVEGFGLGDGYSPHPIDQKHNLHYIRIKPELELGIMGPFSVIGGLNYGYLAFATIQNGNSSSKVSKGTYDNDDLGILAGFNIALYKFNIAFKYNYGVASIFDLNLTDIQGSDLGQVKAKNRFLQVGVGYRIDFKI